MKCALAATATFFCYFADVSGCLVIAMQLNDVFVRLFFSGLFCFFVIFLSRFPRDVFILFCTPQRLPAAIQRITARPVVFVILPDVSFVRHHLVGFLVELIGLQRRAESVVFFLGLLRVHVGLYKKGTQKTQFHLNIIERINKVKYGPGNRQRRRIGRLPWRPRETKLQTSFLESATSWTGRESELFSASLNRRHMQLSSLFFSIFLLILRSISFIDVTNDETHFISDLCSSGAVSFFLHLLHR